MFSWKKHGLVFRPEDAAGRTWIKEFAQAPATLVFDDFVRVYFSCRPHADERGQYVSHTAFVDLDRKNLMRIVKIADNPIMSLGALGTFDEFGVYPVSVIRDGNEVRAYYGGWTRCESTPYTVAIGAAVSRDDGETFTRVGPGPLLAPTPNEPFVLSGPKIRRFNDRWYLWYVAGVGWVPHHDRVESIYKIRLAQSDDGWNWKRTGQDLLEGRIDEHECQASPDVMFSGGRFHMFYCYKYGVDFRNSARGYRIGYAHSDDLNQWVRDDAKAGIDLSTTGWDSESIAYPHVFGLDGKVYMLYLGNEVGRGGFGLAELEGDM